MSFNGMPTQFFQMASMASMNSSQSSFSSFDVAAEMKKHYASKAALRNKRKWKKPRGKPKRPLSAYNIFFKTEREKMVKAQKKVGFANMAKEVSVAWKALDKEGRKEFVAAAEVEQKKYREAVKEWKAQSKAEMEQMAAQVTASNNQSDPILLQKLIIEQQMLEQQKVMMENAMRLQVQNGPRRSSMSALPMVGSNDTIMGLNGLPAEHTMPLRPPQSSSNRRFSMPLELLKQGLKPESIKSGASTDYGSVDMSTGTSSYDSCYDSTDESTLDDETADMLINMPIMDIEQQQQANGAPKQPPQTLMIPEVMSGGRRSSMPMAVPDHKTSGEATTFRRLSMPVMNEEVAEMQDIMDLLREEDVSFSAKTSMAA